MIEIKSLMRMREYCLRCHLGKKYSDVIGSLKQPNVSEDDVQHARASHFRSLKKSIVHFPVLDRVLYFFVLFTIRTILSEILLICFSNSLTF